MPAQLVARMQALAPGALRPKRRAARHLRDRLVNLRNAAISNTALSNSAPLDN
jgi:hypothetical protein